MTVYDGNSKSECLPVLIPSFGVLKPTVLVVGRADKHSVAFCRHVAYTYTSAVPRARATIDPSGPLAACGRHPIAAIEAAQPHTSIALLQMPRLEHSAMRCAVWLSIGTSPHAGPEGHTLAEQSGAQYNVTSLVARHKLYLQVQIAVTPAQLQCPLQLSADRSLLLMQIAAVYARLAIGQPAESRACLQPITVTLYPILALSLCTVLCTQQKTDLEDIKLSRHVRGCAAAH
jgi:hypothetical protein